MKLLSPITTFIIASTGIHVAIIMSSNSDYVMLPASSGSIISISMEDKKNTPIKKHNNKNNISHPKNNFNKNPPPPKKNSNDISTNQVASLTRQNESRAQVTSVLIEEFNQYFSYPKIAIKRNRQGKVLLSLRVSSSGKIKDIQIKSSSGYDVLDQAAIESMYKVKKLPKISSWLKYDIELKLPVIYKLTKS